MKNWDQFCADAAEFRIAPEQLDTVREFYDRLDTTFFHAVFSAFPGPVPREKIESLFPGEYRKFNFILAASSWKKLKELYASRHYPETMLEDIRSDLRCWTDKAMEDFGYAGLDWRILNWETDVLTGKVLQFGRLQCNIPDRFRPELSLIPDGNVMKIVPGKEKIPGGLLGPGDPVINLHIPATGPLRKELCLDSLRKIHDFSTRFLPDHRFKAFVCYSWILDPVFAEFNPDSNLAAFQKLGYLFPLGMDQTQEVIWRVFGRAGVEEGIRPELCRTSMQKAVFAHLKSGGRFTEYGMVKIIGCPGSHS